MQLVEIGAKYRHYKGNEYRVITIGKHSETEEELVVYESLQKDDVWVRPLSMWNNVVKEDGTLRFVKID